MPRRVTSGARYGRARLALAALALALAIVPGSARAGSQVTLAQLMQHTSGVPSFTTDPEFLERFGADPRGYFSRQS